MVTSLQPRLYDASRRSQLLSVATARVRAEQRAHSAHLPRVDYVELQRRFNTDIIDYDAYAKGRLGQTLRRTETQLRSDLFFAVRTALRHQHYPTVFAMSERIGLPLAALRRARLFRPNFIAMFTCWSPRQELAMQSLRLHEAMDLILVQCSSMVGKIASLGVAHDKIRCVPFGVDATFFRPIESITPVQNQVYTIGEGRSRDYATLFKAVENSDINLTATAAGYWFAREKKGGVDGAVPDNVTLTERLDPVALRKAYASSQVVALPVYPAVYSAGLTAMLEAMAMGRPVVATDSPGLRDVIVDGENGLIVPSGDVRAWRAAICSLIANPQEAARLGGNARRTVERTATLDLYVDRLAATLTEHRL